MATRPLLSIPGKSYGSKWKSPGACENIEKNLSQKILLLLDQYHQDKLKLNQRVQEQPQLNYHEKFALQTMKRQAQEALIRDIGAVVSEAYAELVAALTFPNQSEKVFEGVITKINQELDLPKHHINLSEVYNKFRDSNNEVVPCKVVYKAPQESKTPGAAA